MTIYHHTVQLVSLDRLFFKILNSVQTKGIAALVYMFGGVCMCACDYVTDLCW